MDVEHLSGPLHHEGYPHGVVARSGAPECSSCQVTPLLCCHPAYTWDIIMNKLVVSDKHQQPEFFCLVISWYGILPPWFPKVWLHRRWIYSVFPWKSALGLVRMSKLGEAVFSEHCLPDLGQLIFTVLLTSLCIVINFERAAMQEDESLKL